MIGASLLVAAAMQAAPPARLNFGPPSVSAEAYPRMIVCTLAKHRDEVARLLQTRDDAMRRRIDMGDWSAESQVKYESVPVTLADGRVVAANRLVIDIVKACHPLQEGKPLGFSERQLYDDWRAALKGSGA